MPSDWLLDGATQEISATLFHNGRCLFLNQIS